MEASKHKRLKETLPSIRLIRRVFILLLLFELLIIIAIETTFMHNNFITAGERSMEPVMQSIVFPAGLAIESLNASLANEVVHGLINTGNFESARILDDFGVELARASVEVKPNIWLEYFGKFINIEISKTIYIPIKTSSGGLGYLEATAQYSNLLIVEIRQSLSRMLMISATSLILGLFVATVATRRIIGGVQSMVSWTEKIAKHISVDNPSLRSFQFEEFRILANRTSEAFDAKNKLVKEILGINKEKNEILQAVSAALSAVDIFACLFTPTGEVIFSNAANLPNGPIRAVFGGKPRSPYRIIRFLESRGAEVVWLESAEADQQSANESNSFRFQVTVSAQSWILQSVTVGDKFQLLSGTEITDIRARDRNNLHAEKLEVVGRLTSGVAVEFGNMLEIITKSIQVVTGRNELSPKDNEYLLTALSASGRASVAVRQVKQLSLDHAEERRVFDLSAWSKAATPFIEAVLGPSVSLTITCADGLNICVEPSLFDMSIINLCKNSFDAMPRGGLIHIDIVPVSRSEILRIPQLNPELKFARIAICDTGPGVSEEVAASIFEPFFSTKEKSQWVGLGLSTVQNFIKISHGFIRVDTEYTEGARFEMYLPLEEAPDAHQPAPILHSSGGKLAGVRVLILEDEKLLAQSFAMALNRSGAITTTCHTLQESMELVRSGSKFDVAVLDNFLSDGLGIHLATELKKGTDSVLCLGVSGDPSNNMAGHKSIDIYVQKPLSLTRLVNIIEDEVA